MPDVLIWSTNDITNEIVYGDVAWLIFELFESLLCLVRYRGQLGSPAVMADVHCECGVDRRVHGAVSERGEGRGCQNIWFVLRNILW